MMNQELHIGKDARIKICLSEVYTNDDWKKWLHNLPDASHFSILVSLGDKLPLHQNDIMLAWGAKAIFKASGKNDLSKLNAFYNTHKDWVFGHLNYELKDQIEDLQSRHQTKIGFDEICFFVPQFLLTVENGKVYLHTHKNEEKQAFQWWELLNDDHYPTKNTNTQNKADILKPLMTKDEYLHAAEALLAHIKRGDIYEVNFCQYFLAENVELSPEMDFIRWTEKTKAPFSALYRQNDCYLFSASPERFLHKKGTKLYAQPIKGTAPRFSDPIDDEKSKQNLYNSEKERAENVMIVDLMRNDLSRFALTGSVQVDELFGIYSFQQVHQMVSTISAEVPREMHPTTILSACFPVGSMTGAPKISAMKLIDRYENCRRELYSGSIGYIDPEGDFDFSVVIRSLLYNARTKTALAGVGSALTFYADPEKEYEECFWKLNTITKIFTA